MHTSLVKLTILSNRFLSTFLSSILFSHKSKTQWSYKSKSEKEKLVLLYVVYARIKFLSNLSKYPPLLGENIWIKWNIEEELNEK